MNWLQKCWLTLKMLMPSCYPRYSRLPEELNPPGRGAYSLYSLKLARQKKKLEVSAYVFHSQACEIEFCRLWPLLFFKKNWEPKVKSASIQLWKASLHMSITMQLQKATLVRSAAYLSKAKPDQILTQNFVLVAIKSTHWNSLELLHKSKRQQNHLFETKPSLWLPKIITVLK